MSVARTQPQAEAALMAELEDRILLSSTGQTGDADAAEEADDEEPAATAAEPAVRRAQPRRGRSPAFDLTPRCALACSYSPRFKWRRKGISRWLVQPLAAGSALQCRSCALLRPPVSCTAHLKPSLSRSKPATDSKASIESGGTARAGAGHMC